jgi:3-mercaptopyruvate sulfurtransferase SseA
VADRDAWSYPADTAVYEEKRIPGARFFPISQFSDALSKTPLKLPIAEDFSQKLSDLGVAGSDHIVVYDSRGMVSSPRLHWLFKSFGHERVSVLDGGLPSWTRLGLPLETGQPAVETREPTRYVARRNESVFLDYQRMWDNVLNNFINPDAYQIVDARQPAVWVSLLLCSVRRWLTRFRSQAFGRTPRPLPQPENSTRSYPRRDERSVALGFG